MADEILRMEHISKHFGGVTALDNVNFSCNRGEIHVLAGENGAGKSTILKILSGVYAADGGEIYWNQQKVEIKNPLQNLKTLYGTGFQRLNSETNKQEIVGGVKYTIKDGIVYDAKQLLGDVRKMVADDKARHGITELMQPGQAP